MLAAESAKCLQSIAVWIILPFSIHSADPWLKARNLHRRQCRGERNASGQARNKLYVWLNNTQQNCNTAYLTRM